MKLQDHHLIWLHNLKSWLEKLLQLEFRALKLEILEQSQKKSQQKQLSNQKFNHKSKFNHKFKFNKSHKAKFSKSHKAKLNKNRKPKLIKNHKVWFNLLIQLLVKIFIHQTYTKRWTKMNNQHNNQLKSNQSTSKKTKTSKKQQLNKMGTNMMKMVNLIHKLWLKRRLLKKKRYKRMLSQRRRKRLWKVYRWSLIKLMAELRIRKMFRNLTNSKRQLISRKKTLKTNYPQATKS